MNTKSILIPIIFAAALFPFLFSCSEAKKSDTMDHHDGHASNSEQNENGVSESTPPQFQVDKKFQEQLAGLFTAYVELKDALVASDQEKVKAEATDAKEELKKVDMKLLSGSAHNDWMNFLAQIETSLQEITTAADIEDQRKSFSLLSDNLYKSVKAFGLGGKEAFYEYCPMAFNNEGGYWLSDQEKIRNPYFGEKMLTCGQVKEKLK